MKFIRGFGLLFSLFAAVAMCGCSEAGDSRSAMEKIQDQLTQMQSYKCTADVTRISNKGENTFSTVQYYNSTDEYRMEITAPESAAGNYTVYDGKKVYQYNSKLNSNMAVEVDENQARNELFLGQFVKNYMQSEGVAVETAKMDEGRCTVLEAVIPGNYKYTSTEKLWVDNETLKPVQFIIYDIEGKERYIVTYNEFEYNVEFEDGTFKVPQ